MANKTLLEIIVGLKDQTSGGLKNIAANAKSFGEGVKKAFHSAPVRLFRHAIVALGTALVTAVVEGAKFNVEMSRVWTMAGGGISTFKDLREQARNLSSEFGIARSAMANGMYNALSAGVDKAGLESFMSTAAKVAVADGSDISVAVDGITTVLNAFKIEASKTGDVADDMFQTVAMGKTTFGELAANLATVAPVAAASKIPLKQILAHVAALTAQGTPTAQAMTQIRASITGLNRSLGDGWSKNMSYQDALKKVWDKARGSQTELLKLVGSSEAVQAVLGGVGRNAELAADKLTGMSNTAGALSIAFWKVDQFRHWAPLLESTRGLLSKLGEEIDKRLSPFVLKITKQLQTWSKDKGLWAAIGTFLDNSAGTLDTVVKQAGEIIGQIESVEDLKEAAGKLSDWLKDKLKEAAGKLADWLKDKLKKAGIEIVAYLAEKAPIVGNAIGKAAWNAIKGPAGDQSAALQQTRTQFGLPAGGDFSFKALGVEMSSAFRDALAQNKEAIRNDRLTSEGKALSSQIEISDQSQQTRDMAAKGQALRNQILNPGAPGGSSGEAQQVASAQGASNESLSALLAATLEQHRIVQAALAAQQQANEVLKRQVANNRG